MTLHLIQLPIDLRSLHAWGETRGLAQGVLDEGLALHHLLGESFGPAALRPFRLMVASGARVGTLFAYSAQSSGELGATAAVVVDPAAARVLGLSAMESLPRPESAWHPGQRLGFDIRLRPVVRLASALRTDRETFRKGAEMDAFLAHVLRKDDGAVRGEIYLRWLTKRLEGAAEIDPALTRLSQFERRVIVRNRQRIDGPDATFHGTLTVTDPGAFAALLARGIGRHLTYGYGMLMLRPPQKAT